MTHTPDFDGSKHRSAVAEEILFVLSCAGIALLIIGLAVIWGKW